MGNWRRAKGLIKATNQCPRCHGEYSDDEYSIEDDECLFCLFPETSGRRPVPMNHTYGVPKNETDERKLLDDLEYVPEKQSKASKKAYNNYKNRKYYK